MVRPEKNTGIAETVHADVTSALFELFRYLPISGITSIVSMVLILIFLVTSGDTATYILASMTSEGSLNPPQKLKVVWGVLISVIAGVLLYAGGLEALQTASLIAALPFTILLILLIAAVIKLVRFEPLPIRKIDLKRFRQLEKLSQQELDKKKKNNK